MVEITAVELIQDRRGWAVDLTLEGRRERRRYRYGSEAQARYFAAVFELKPTQLPPGHTRVRVPETEVSEGSSENIQGAFIAELATRRGLGASDLPDADDLESAFTELELDLCG